MTDKPQQKRFTGWHMTAILVAFFGVVIVVNFAMARFAMSTFGGKVVENSYVASQHYNEWLDRAAAQEQLGWKEEAALDADRHIRLAVRKDGRPLTSLMVTATLSHPLGRAEPVAVRFVTASDGTLRSVDAVPAGRWRLDFIVRHAADEARYRIDLK
ncbi:MAG: FixH family protein [Sphingopyxis sp.]|uniref:FixH family protein n=1 Tax=Sphingopyxis sp. TaxID=1908224 RepID=UPI002AB999E6|nr:FixH family protein [Sphingopyxis sp.]MDZ3832870.1 FixH family protein [Sphingopyxis sp.]